MMFNMSATEAEEGVVEQLKQGEDMSSPPNGDIILPTYHLKPQENKCFYPSKAKLIANDILQVELDTKVNEKWVEDWSDFGDQLEELSKDIADKIKEKCKSTMDLPRYKIIVQVTIGQMRDQGVRMTSRSLWDTTTDNYATVSYQNQNIWASAIVFGLLLIECRRCMDQSNLDRIFIGST